MYDFDSGLAANDAFGFFFGNSDLGRGTDEVSSAPGDSGGPSFDGPVITGITSFGTRLAFINGSSSDVDATINSSFGEFSGDTRVSSYASFVDSVVPPPDTTPPFITIQFPANGTNTITPFTANGTASAILPYPTSHSA